MKPLNSSATRPPVAHSEQYRQLPTAANVRGPPVLQRGNLLPLQKRRLVLVHNSSNSQAAINAGSTATVQTGSSYYSHSHANTPEAVNNTARGHAAVAALAAPVPGLGYPAASKWSLLLPGVALGAVLTLTAQRVGRWVLKITWVQQLCQALDLNWALSTAADDDMLPHERELRFLGSPVTSDSEVDQAYTRTKSRSPDVPPLISQSMADTLKDQGESVEWVNMCLRKAWRVYQRGLERWITDLLQPVFDSVVKDGSVPQFVQRLRIVEFTLDHEAPYFTNMRRRYSRKDSDLTGVVDLRYTGGARMLLMLEVGGGRWRFKVPVLVSDLDLDCQMWIKIRLAPMCPWIGTLSLAFVGPPNVKVQLSPYNRVRLMRVPVVQSFLRKLLTVDLPGFMVLPKRLEVAIPPSVTSVAEAAVGRDTIMRAVASAVLQADAVEQALLAALPLGPQTPAGGISLPEAFQGELDVVLKEARDLPVWGFPGQSNPYVRLVLGEQAVQSRRDDDTSSPGRHKHPVWNQEFQFLVESPDTQKLQIFVRDSHLTGRVDVGSCELPLAEIARSGERASIWLPLTPPAAYTTRGKETQGEVLLEVSYKAFVEEYDEHDSGYREAQAFQRNLGQALAGTGSQEPITDIRSAAAASSRAAVAASAAISAIAMTKAAAARAATRAARAAQAAAEQAVAVAGIPKATSSMDGTPAPDSGSRAGSRPPALPPPKDSVTASVAVNGSDKRVETTILSEEEYEDGMGVASIEQPGDKPTSQQPAVSGQPLQPISHANGSPAHNGKPHSLPSSHMHHTEHTAGLPLREHMQLAPSKQSASRTHHEGDSNSALSGPVVEVMESSKQMKAKTHVVATATTALEADPQLVPQNKQTLETAITYEVTTESSVPLDKVKQGPSEPKVTEVKAVSAVYDNEAVIEVEAHNQADISAQGKLEVHSPLIDGRATLDSEAAGWSVLQTPAEGFESSRQISSEVVPAEVVEISTQEQTVAVEAAVSSEEGDKQKQAQQQKQAQHPAIPLLMNRVHDLGLALGSAWEVARNVLPGAAAQKPAGSQAETDKPSKPAEVPDQDTKTESEEKKAVSNNDSWMAPIFAALSVLTSNLPQPQTQPTTDKSAKTKNKAGEDDRQEQSATDSQEDKEGKDSKPWWQFWPSDDKIKQTEASATDKQQPGDSQQESQQDKDKKEKPWWQFWGESNDSKPKETDAQSQNADGSKPVEAIIIPADLPLEEIAKEVAKLKDESWRSKGERAETLWARAVERNDRPWIILCATLLAVACALLAAVAWRLDHATPDGVQDIAVPLATLQLLMQLLRQ